MPVLDGGPIWGLIPLTNTRMSVGRVHQGNQIIVTDVTVDEHHAVIQPHPTGRVYGITALGANRVFVNEQPLIPSRPYWLNPGDRIRIETTTFIYQVSSQSGTGTSFLRLERSSVPAVPLSAVRYYIGRPQPGNQIIISVNSTATNYAVIQPRSSSEPLYGIAPLGTSLVLVNEQQLIPRRWHWLNSEDRIHIGRIPFTYKSSQPAQASAAQKPGGSDIGTFIVIALLVIGAIAYFSQNPSTSSHSASQPSTPQSTLTAFCSAVKSENYQTAYDQLSSSAQKHETEQQFASQLKQAFANQGGVKNCTAGKVQQQKSTVTATLTYTFVKGNMTTYTISLIDETNTWRIGSMKLLKE